VGGKVPHSTIRHQGGDPESMLPPSPAPTLENSPEPNKSQPTNPEPFRVPSVPNRPYPRPAHSVVHWSIFQVSRFIRAGVADRSLTVLFAPHAIQRGQQRNVSPTDVLKIISKGRALSIETPAHTNDVVRCKFEFQETSRRISTVVEINDITQNIIVIITSIA
jgi:hypothetical protein